MPMTPISRNELPSAWWRTATLYQVFVRSFADSNGDGLGDLAGITDHLQHIADLGADALWLTPFYPSPQVDTGYDVVNHCDVDPAYGSLNDFDTLLARAHALGLKVFVDIVPNHTSDKHPWFEAALKAAPGSAERNRYLFFDGRDNGRQPPNNWHSWFGSSAWTSVHNDRQWYMHTFSPQQPDLNWRNPEVRAEFLRIFQFWLDRGVDGFRIDAPTVLIKPNTFQQDLHSSDDDDDEESLVAPDNQPELFEIFKEWRTLIDKHGAHCLIGEVFPDSPEDGLENFIDKAGFNQLFCFDYELAAWEADQLREVIDGWLAAAYKYDTTPIWVTSSHDQVRQVSCLGLSNPGEKPDGLGPDDEQPDLELGEQRARALAVITMALPGAVCIYYGEELGLPNHTKLTEEERQDPYDRDGCRIPMPWKAHERHCGFTTANKAWLPQPRIYRRFAVDAQTDDPDSMLSLYRSLLDMRRELGLGEGKLRYMDSDNDDVIIARNGDICLVANLSDKAVDMPKGTLLAKSMPEIEEGGMLPSDTAVWLRWTSVMKAAV